MRHGIPRALGIDLASRVGLNNLMLMSLNSEAGSDEEWYVKTLFDLLGPIGGMGGSVFKSIDYWREGEWRRRCPRRYRRGCVML